MLPALVVSPHFDDAVLSAGQFLAGRPDTWVATVCTGFPDPPMPTEFDRNSGFGDSSAAMAARELEDRAALGLLGVARRIRLDVLDGQYADGEGERGWVTGHLADLLLSLLDELLDAGGTVVLAPLGIGHPDHVLTSNAAIRAAATRDVELWLYEELPYRVWEPDAALYRRDELGGRLELEFPGTGPLERKRQAVAEYRSQLWAVDGPAISCPERFWRVL